MKEELFNERLSLMEDYRKSNKNNPDKNEKYKGHPIGRYEETFRRIHNSGKELEDGSFVLGNTNLTKEQVSKLEMINFDWENNKEEIEWNNMYRVLIIFIKEYRRLPLPDESYKGELVGRWLEYQNAIITKGKLQEDGSIKTYYISISKEQIEKLRKVNAIRVKLTKWEINYNKYVNYINNNKDIEKNESLAKWEKNQKYTYNYGKKNYNGTIKYQNNTLDKEKIKKLNLINFDFNI
ncbi:MAG: hypothetical protein IKE73_01590 [Bacilli bacterium]|nr:hypothetical protein [Bacilli bacterium]